MKTCVFTCLLGTLLLHTAAFAVGPYTENFNSGAANWRQNVSATSVIQNGAGGPDGSAYVSSDFSFVPNPSMPQVALFRAHDEFNASGDAFVGNWLAANIIHVSGVVRHDAPQELDFFLRVAKAANSPAVSFTLPQTVQPNIWTPIGFNISFANPLRTNEGPPTAAFYNDVLANIGNIQFGVIIPAALANDANVYRYDLDSVNVVPEPAGICIVAIGTAACIARRRRRLFG